MIEENKVSPQKKKTRVLLHGAFSTSNYGDFLFYEIFKEKISNHADVVVGNPGKYIRMQGGYKRKSEFIQLIKSSKVVFSSGGYFGEPDSSKLRLLKWRIKWLYKHVRISLATIVLRKPYAIIGIGVGPIRFGLGRLLFRFVFNKAAVISVRDKESFDYLIKTGVRNQNIHITSDLVLSNENILKEKIKKIDSSDESEKTVLYHVTGGRKSINHTIPAIKEFLEKNKTYKLVLCTDINNNVEHELLSRIESDFSNKYKFIDYSPERLTYEISKSSLVISHKLHVCIVSATLSKSVISIPHHSKIPRFFNQIGEPKRVIDSKDITAKSIFNLMQQYIDKPISIQSSIIESSKENSEILDSFLKS